MGRLTIKQEQALDAAIASVGVTDAELAEYIIHSLIPLIDINSAIAHHVGDVNYHGMVEATKGVLADQLAMGWSKDSITTYWLPRTNRLEDAVKGARSAVTTYRHPKTPKVKRSRKRAVKGKFRKAPVLVSMLP
jgi:hypothetical protein